MAQYVIDKCVGGVDDGKLEISTKPTQFKATASGDGPLNAFVYLYAGEEIDGNVTLRIFRFDKSVPTGEVLEYVTRRLNEGDN